MTVSTGVSSLFHAPDVASKTSWPCSSSNLLTRRETAVSTTFFLEVFDKTNSPIPKTSITVDVFPQPAILFFRLFVRFRYFPFLEKLIFKLMGVSLGKNCSLHEAWIDCEFVEIGNNVKIGQGSLIISNILIKDKLIIKKKHR